MEAKKEMVKQNCKSQPNAEEEASILESVQDLNYTFSTKTKIQLWPLLKIHPNFFISKLSIVQRLQNSDFQGYFPISKIDWIFPNMIFIFEIGELL